MLGGIKESRRPIRRSGLKTGLLFSLGLIVASKGVLAQEDVTSAKPKTEQDHVFKPEKGYDPVKDLCQRYGQQTVIAQDTLYIDGGLWVNKDQASGKQIRDIQPLQSMLTPTLSSFYIFRIARTLFEFLPEITPLI